MPDQAMPDFRDPSGSIWVWDQSSHSYVLKQDAFPVPDRGHATGGDNDLFSPNQLEHSELAGTPELEGHMAAQREFADPGQVLCPQCRESTDQPICEICGRDLTPEWNQFKHKHPGEEFQDVNPTPDVASEFTSWPDRAPKRNRQKTDDSFPSMVSSLQWVQKIAAQKMSQDDWDELFEGPQVTEIGKWIQDRKGQMHFDHGVHGVHEDLAARQGLNYPDDIGALGSVYNTGLADTQRVFPGHQFDHPSVQQQINQAFGPSVTLNPPVHHQGVIGKGAVFEPFVIQSGTWLVHSQPGQSFITGVAWVRERPPHGPYLPNMILCAEHLQPEDYGLYVNGAKAILTGTGGLTSHAAMLASTMSIPVVVGIGAEYNKLESGNYLKIDPITQTIMVAPGASSKQDPDIRRQIADKTYQYYRQNDPYVQQGVAASLTPKPQFFGHYLEELEWHQANDASLADCPECHSPMVDKSNEKICHSCGHKQPILHMGTTKEGFDWNRLNPVNYPMEATELAGKGLQATGIPGVEQAGSGLEQAAQGTQNIVNKGTDWAIQHPEEAALIAGGAGLMATGIGAPEGAAMEGAALGGAEGAGALEGAGAAGLGSRLLGLGGQGLKGLGLSEVLHGVGGAMNGAMGGGQGGYGQPSQNISLPGAISHMAGTFGDEEKGTATKNRGENSDPEIGSSPEKKEIGDSPEQLKDVGGGPVGHDDQSGHNLHGGDPALQEKALKAFELNKPLVIEFMNSDESGADHPILQALDQLLEAAFPGYKGTSEQIDPLAEKSPVAEIEDSHEDTDEKPEEKDDATKKKEAAKMASVWHFAGPYADPNYIGKPMPDERSTVPMYEDELNGDPYGETGDWEEPQENPECPMCGGPGVPLGALGRREHFRCRNCGMDFSHETTPSVGAIEQEKGPAYFASEKIAIQTMPQPAGVPGQAGMGQIQGQPFPMCPKCGYPHDPTMPCANSMSNPAGTPGAAVNPAPYAVGMQGVTPPIPQKVVTHIENDFGDWTAARGEGTWRSDESDEPEEEDKEPKHEFDVETDEERNEKTHSGHVHDPDPQFDSHITAALDRYAGDWDHEKKIQETPSEHHHHEDADFQDWKDDSGQPLQEGAEYEMHTAGSEIPDRVTILASNPHKITFMIHSGDVDYQHQLDRKQADLDGTTFTAPTSGIDSESGSDMGDIPPIRPGQDPAPQVDDLSTPSTHASSTEKFTGAFGREIQPLGEYVGSFRGDNPDDRNWLMGGGESSAVEVDPTLMSKFAGKDYTPREQREFIDEGDGGLGARNLDRLDLSDTHYIDEDLHLTDSLW